MAITSANEDKILGAIGSLNLIRILYAKEKKPGQFITQRVVRIVEPYQIKEETLIDGSAQTYLYAWDTTKGKTIKSFILGNINNVLVLGSKFKDRYPDEGEAFPTIESRNPPDARRMRPAVNTTAFV